MILAYLKETVAFKPQGLMYLKVKANVSHIISS